MISNMVLEDGTVRCMNCMDAESYVSETDVDPCLYCDCTTKIANLLAKNTRPETVKVGPKEYSIPRYIALECSLLKETNRLRRNNGPIKTDISNMIREIMAGFAVDYRTAKAIYGRIQ